jgi:hypothetical protein
MHLLTTDATRKTRGTVLPAKLSIGDVRWVGLAPPAAIVAAAAAAVEGLLANCQN